MTRAVLLACAAVLAGCGSSGEDDFAARGNAICRDVERRIEALGRPPVPTSRDPAQVKRWQAYRRRAAAIGRRTIPKLRALEPPEDKRRMRDDVFADLERLNALTPALTRLNRELTRATASGERRAIERVLARGAAVLRRETALEQRIDREFRELGWPACANA